MDEYIFRSYMDNCSYDEEPTSYLEILTYSDPLFNTIEEHRFSSDELEDEFANFLHRRGAFAPPKLPPNVEFLGGVRMILQTNADKADTFSPRHVSLKPEAYEEMLRTWALPLKAIESTSAVGPFFWSVLDRDSDHPDKPHLQVVFRKSDVKKRGKTRGWELTLSHSFQTGITSGYLKGTASSSDILSESLRHLKACASSSRQILHPLLLPIIIFGREIQNNDERQRDARDWLRQLEHAVSLRQEVLDGESRYVKEGEINLDLVNHDLVECHSQVLWKRPQAYQEVIKGINAAMDRFWSAARDNRRYFGEGSEIEKLHRSLLSRLDFYRVKLTGIEHYARTTLERLELQRAALYNIIAQKESKLNLQMAGEQRRLAHRAKRDSTSMKMLSLMGAVFLPATFIASIFSMSFFDFIPDDPDAAVPSVSPLIWIYFAFTIPVTAVAVSLYLWWERRREARYAAEDRDIEAGIEEMEQQIMTTMRKRVVTRVRTWNVDAHRTGTGASASGKE